MGSCKAGVGRSRQPAPLSFTDPDSCPCYVAIGLAELPTGGGGGEFAPFFPGRRKRPPLSWIFHQSSPKSDSLTTKDSIKFLKGHTSYRRKCQTLSHHFRRISVKGQPRQAINPFLPEKVLLCLYLIYSF